MLQKNIYILYPAGYYGTYLNWAISASDVDMSKTTVLDPINNSDSRVLGGSGTSHLHKKIPTHQAPNEHLMWVLHNQPKEPKIYNINMGREMDPDINKFISFVLSYDTDPVFINIHADSPDVMKFGAINSIQKWPTQYEVRKLRRTFSRPELTEYDPFNCANDIKYRNLVVKHDSEVFRYNHPIDYDKLAVAANYYNLWYSVRHKLQPQEINTDTYIDPETYLKDNKYLSTIWELSCRDVASENFPNILDNILNGSQCSSQYNTSHVHGFHHKFTSAQQNLQWFASIDHWRKTGELDQYLLSHSAIQGFVIQEILHNSGVKNANVWKESYHQLKGASWPDVIPDSFHQLPELVKQEFIDNGYNPCLPTMDTLPWETMTLDQINRAYQSVIKL
jgi:hypothetical protein